MPQATERFLENQSLPARFPNWNPEAYIQKAAKPEYRSRKDLSTLLEADWTNFSIEYIEQTLVSRIPMTVDPRLGITGLNASYKESLTEQGRGYIDNLEKQNKSVTRGNIEEENLIKLDQWSLSAPIHSLFIWTSPPYPPAENRAKANTPPHSFVFVYEKTADNEVVLHQFCNWMNLSDHLKLQSFIGNRLQQNPDSLKHALIKNTTIAHPPAGCSPEQTQGWASSRIAKIKDFVYSTTDNWAVSPDQLPTVPEDEYQLYSDFLISLYIRKVVPLLLNKVPEKTPENNDWESFYNSVKYRELVKQLNLFFAYLVYQPLLKFAEDGSESALAQMNFTQIEQHLELLYQTKLKELQGQNPTSQERDHFNQYSADLLSVNPGIFSQGQCGLGALFSNQLNNPQMINGLSSASNLTPPQLLSSEMSQLSLQEKQTYLAELKKYQPLYVFNKDTGQTETWYAKFTTNKTSDVSAYKNNCYIKNGQVFGPCDEPLTPGPVAIKHQDEHLDMSSLMPEKQYLKYLQMFEQSQTNKYFAEELKNKSLEEVLLDQAENATEKRKIKQLLKTARSLLSNKQVVAVTELLSGEIYHPLLKGVLNQLSKYAPISFILNSLIKERGGNLTDPTATTMTTAQASPATV